jgi:tetrahydromethanopterin S-methyltransferase subunit G
MDDMSHEFGEMLKETLDKMSEKIEATSNEWEQDAGGNVEKRLEELHMGPAT